MVRLVTPHYEKKLTLSQTDPGLTGGTETGIINTAFSESFNKVQIHYISM